MCLYDSAINFRGPIEFTVITDPFRITITNLMTVGEKSISETYCILHLIQIMDNVAKHLTCRYINSTVDKPILRGLVAGHLISHCLITYCWARRECYRNWKHGSKPINTFTCFRTSGLVFCSRT